MSSVKFLVIATVCTGFLSVGCRHSTAQDSSTAHVHSGKMEQMADCKCGKGCTNCKVEGETEKKCGCAK